MILVFVLLWFSSLWGMEVDQPKVQAANVILPVPSLEELSRIPSLLSIVKHAVYCHIINKKITIKKAKELADSLFQPIEYKVLHTVCDQIIDKRMSIEDVRKSLPVDIFQPTDSQIKVLSHRDIEYFQLPTITPNHRYILGKSKESLLRLDLEQNKISFVANLKENILVSALSPSGNLAALVSPQKLWIKDITQNKEIAENNLSFLNGDIQYIAFIGEKGLVVKDELDVGYMSVEENLSNHLIDGRLLGILHTSLEYVTMPKTGEILRNKIEKGATPINASYYIIPRYYNLKPALYEPSLLMAYVTLDEEILDEEIIVISLQPKEIESRKKNSLFSKFRSGYLARYKGGEGKITALAFAHEGRWLIIAGYNKNGPMLTIWDWKNNQQIYTSKLKESVSYIFSTDDPYTPYPCLVECPNPLFYSSHPINNVICSFDPIKMVAVSMLSQATSRQTEATSNDNNSNNNNNNASNDNGPKPATSGETSKQDNRERRYKRPKK